MSIHLKHLSQNGNLPQIGVKITNLWNHHLKRDIWLPIFSTNYYCHMFLHPISHPWNLNPSNLQHDPLNWPPKPEYPKTDRSPQLTVLGIPLGFSSHEHFWMDEKHIGLPTCPFWTIPIPSMGLVYIYLHLMEFYAKCRYIYMDPMGFPPTKRQQK